jgi:hypothetical protein
VLVSRDRRLSRLWSSPSSIWLPIHTHIFSRIKAQSCGRRAKGQERTRFGFGVLGSALRVPGSGLRVASSKFQALTSGLPAHCHALCAPRPPQLRSAERRRMRYALRALRFALFASVLGPRPSVVRLRLCATCPPKSRHAGRTRMRYAPCALTSHLRPSGFRLRSASYGGQDGGQADF